MRDNDSQKIIVVGIPKTMDDAGLSELFSGFGTVAEAKVVLDVNNKQPRGFGFVTFTSGAAMRAAIQGMNKKVVEGRTLNVRQLVPKDKFQAEKAKDENAQDAANRPCWLLRKGKCTKGDQCPFSHETKNGEFGSCFEFMQTGECKRGDKCIFSHKIATATDGAVVGESDDAAAAAQPASAAKKASKSVTATATASAAASMPKTGEQKPRVCYAFQKGKCHRGKKCLFLHEKVPEMVNDQPVVMAKPAAASAAKRGEFEVVTQVTDSASKKRSRVDSHDDDDDGMESDADVPMAPAVKTAMAPTVKKEPMASAVKRESVVAAVKKDPVLKQSAPVAAKPVAPTAVTPSTKRPREVADESKSKAKSFEKRPRFDPSKAQVDKPLHPAAKRIQERALQQNGPSKYGDGQVVASQQSKQQQQSKPKLSANDRFAKRAARNNKSALQRQKRKNRLASEQDGGSAKPAHQSEQSAQPAPAPKKRVAERVDMGAAFDGLSDDDRKPRKSRVVDKAQQKANREKAQLERRAKRAAKKTALSRLQTSGEVAL